MRLSPYDPKHDGKCDVSICNGLAFINISQFSASTPSSRRPGQDRDHIVPRDLSVTTAFNALFPGRTWSRCRPSAAAMPTTPGPTATRSRTSQPRRSRPVIAATTQTSA